MARIVPTSTDLLSIGDLSRACGIATETLRVWERRYGQPAPVRLPSGHRRYTSDQAEWLCLVHELLAYGHRAGSLLAQDPQRLADLAASERASRGDVRVEDLLREFRASGPERLRASLIEALRSPGARWWILGGVGDFLALIGREWAGGRLSIAQEHAICQVIEDVLRSERCRLEGELAPSAPALTLATISGEQHGLGLQMAALACAAAGGRALLLGVDLPATEIAAATRDHGARAAAVSVSLAQASPEVGRKLAELRRLLPAGIQLLVGGLGARAACRGLSDCTVMEQLSDLDEWLRRASRPDSARP